MDGVELALGGAEAAADALVLVDLGSAAAKAAGGFLAYLLFGEGQAVIGESLGLCSVVAGNLTRGVVKADGDDGLFLVELDELAAVAAKSQALAGIDEAVQRLCADESGSDGVDGELRPGDKVAAGEDVVLRGLAGDRVNDHGAVLVKGHALGGDAAEIDLLTDRADNAVDLDGLILAGADRLAAALFVRLAELHTLDLERTDLAILADDLDRETRENYLKMSLEQLRKLGGMIEQILSTSMKRRKTFTLNKEEIYLHNTLADIVEEQRLRAKKPLDISLNVVPDKLTLLADRQHFMQIISNICDNAIKYSRDNVRIGITCKKDTDGNIVIKISDNGIGISKAHQQHIFDKFYRVPNGNLHDVKGYGLGLYYVATMMRLHGGIVEVESEQGKGTTFTLLFRQTT